MAGEAVQRHRLALLALLAAARGQTLPRERLQALLWPEHGAREGRHLLNVAAHVLRKALGDQVLRTEGTNLRLDLAHLAVDVADFRSAVREGRPADAMALYAPFLDGFYLDGAHDFERWQEEERRSIEREFEKAAELRAIAAEQAGEWGEAIRCWRILSRDGERARDVVRLMRALEKGGDRASALAAAVEHREAMARLGVAPSAEVLEAAEGLRQVRGTARAVSAGAAELPLPPLVSDPPVASRPPAARTVERRASPAPRPLRWPWMVGALAALVLALATALGGTGKVAPASVAVLPFQDLSAGRDQGYLGEGLTEELLNALARIPGLQVASRSSAFQYRDPGVDVRKVGRELGVAKVLEGSVRRDGDRLRVTAQLIDARTGYHIWSEEYDREHADVFAVQEDIARQVATALSATLASSLPVDLVVSGTANAEAHDLYLRGRHLWNTRTEEGMLQALGAFDSAIALDPGFAGAWAGLADTWQLLPDYGSVPASQGLARARAAALRAVALDSNLAEGHAALAAVLDDYDRDRAGAEDAYRRAILLNPGYATARQWLAIHLADEGRFAEALSEIERARRLHPGSHIIHTGAGAIRYFARDYPGAIAEYRTVVEQAPDFGIAWALLGRTHLVAGRVDSAVAILGRAVEMSGGDPSYRAVQAAALAAAGQGTQAAEIAASIRSVGPGAYVPWCELASAYAFLGQPEVALQLLEQGFEQRDPALKHLAVEPLYDRLRADPQFQQLLDRAGLPHLPVPGIAD